MLNVDGIMEKPNTDPTLAASVRNYWDLLEFAPFTPVLLTFTYDRNSSQSSADIDLPEKAQSIPNVKHRRRLFFVKLFRTGPVTQDLEIELAAWRRWLVTFALVLAGFMVRTFVICTEI